MAYTKTVWVDGQAPAINADNLNKIENELSTLDGKVMAVGATTNSVTIAATGLRAYILTLPKMLTDALTINVTGTTTDLIWIEGFYGTGSITIQGTAGSSNLNGGVLVLRCAVLVKFDHCNIGPSSESTSRCARVKNSSGCVFFDECYLNGNGSSRGLDASYSATVSFEHGGIKNQQVAVLAGESSVVSVSIQDTTQTTGNTYGGYVWFGGLIMLAYNTPDTIGGNQNIYSGGTIIKKDGQIVFNPGTNLVTTAIELIPTTSATHGGYIDFHYAGSSSDYTSRIIESANGVLSLQANNGVTTSSTSAGGYLVRNEGFATSDTTPSVNSNICWTYG